MMYVTLVTLSEKGLNYPCFPKSDYAFTPITQ